MRTFRSLLSNRRKSASESASAKRRESKQMVEVLERRTLLSAAVHHALASANPVMHPALISPAVGATISSTGLVSSNPNGVGFGQTVTFSVLVTGGAGTPTGSVTLFNGVTNLGTMTLDPSGAASFPISSLPVSAANMISAQYTGDVTYAASSSATVTQTVDNITVSGPSPSAFGTPIQFTATVTPVGATGTVDFYDGGSVIAMGVVVNASGIATTPPISSLSGGSHTIYGIYSGDSTFFGPLQSANFTETITGAPSTTTLNSPTAMSTYGTPVAFTATVGPSGATGTVTFFNNGVAIVGSTTALTAGTATFTTTLTNPLPAGSDKITAVYSGDATYTTSTSTQFTETVSPANTTTTLSVVPGNTVTVGTSLFFTAIVSPLVAGLPSPAGTVTFEDGGVPIGAAVPLSGGTATSPAITSLAVGMHSITAVYTPASDYNTSTSVVLMETVNQGTPTVSVISTTNPSPLGASVTFTATVAGVTGAPTPAQNVTFMDGATILAANVPLVAGTASFTTSSLTVGPHSITVSYSGDVNYVAASTALPLIENIVVGATVTTLTALPASPSSFLTPVTFTANVMPTIVGGPALTGTVSFFTLVGGVPTLIGGPTAVDPLGNASFTTAALPVGTNMIYAVYSGDPNYGTSTSATLNYDIGAASSSTILSTSQGTIALGGTATLTATVFPNVPGTVTFFDNGVALGAPVTLTASIATMNYTSAIIGGHNLTAVYSGNGMYASSTSNTVVETVIGTSSLTSLTASFSSIAVGASDTFTAIVSAPTAGLPTPTGTVTFTENGSTVLGVVTLINGTATLTTSSLALGTDTIVATYSGDSNFGGSVSSGVSVGVFPLTSNTTVTTLTSNTDTIPTGGSVDFTAAVAPSLGTGTTPTGTVTFFNGIEQLSAPITLDNTGVAKLTSSLPTGSVNIVAVYSGASSGYSMSASSPLNENVGVGTRAATFYNTNLGVTANAVAFGVKVTITATVSPTTTGGPSAVGGTVTFANGRTILKTLPVQIDGTATYTVTLPAGTNKITATYSGGAALSVSAPVVITMASSATPTLGLAVLPATAVAGGAFNIKLPVVLTNGGHAPKLHGKFTFNIYANTTATLDTNKVLIKTVTMPGNLDTGQARIFNVNLKSLPAGLAAGAYYVIAEMVDPTGGSNFAATPTTVTVAAAVVTPVATVDVITPGNLSLGTNASILVTITNNGNSTANGPLTITLSPSLDRVTAFGGITFATYSVKSISVPVGQPRTFRLHFKVKNALTPGSYSPLVSVSLAGSTTTAVGSTKFTFS